MLRFLAREAVGDTSARGAVGRWAPGDSFPLHGHDFPEVFWVCEGTGTHLINGRRRELSAGTLVCMRASDNHSLVGGAGGLVIRNVAFSPKWFLGFARRHFPGDLRFWGGAAEVPVHRRLPTAHIIRLDREFDELGRAAAHPRETERFLLNVLHLAVDASAEVEGAMPGWLERALRAWSDPASWAGGTRALARLCGRSEAHVSRVVREVTGGTPTDLLNAHRMRHAAHLLAATDRKVVDIAMECGFSSLGHFYTQFERHHGIAPGRFRRRLPVRPV